MGWGGRVLCARIILTASGGFQNNLRCSRLRSPKSLTRLLCCFDEPTVLILQLYKKQKELILTDKFFLFWLGWQDSNLRMQQSKCCVLPLDDTPIFNFIFRNAAGKGACGIFLGWKMGFEPTISSATNWRFRPTKLHPPYFLRRNAKIIITQYLILSTLFYRTKSSLQYSPGRVAFSGIRLVTS